MREIHYIIVVSWCLATIRVSTIPSTKECAELATCGGGGNGLTCTHITKLRATTEQVYFTTSNSRANITRHWFGGIDTSTIELLYISILYLPCDITGIVSTICFTYTLHCCTGNSAKTSTIDVALCIVFVTYYISSIETCEIELIIVTSSNRYRWMLGLKILILVSSTMELFKPYIASNMEVGYFVSCSIVLSTYPLFHHTALYYIRSSSSITTVILELCDTEQRGVCSLKPSLGLYDTKVI